jgi:mono/diheme cytochrome c family protein
MRRRVAMLVLALAACGEPAELASLRSHGRELFFGRAGCASCHKLGTEGDKQRGPNLGVGDGQDLPVGQRERTPGVRGAAYVIESIVDPDRVIAPGYVSGVMRRYDRPPVSLSDEDIVALSVFLAGCAEADELATARARLRDLRGAQTAAR